MAFYVPPNGRVLLLSGVPMDIKHDHTLWFATKYEQTNYFSSKAVLTVDKVTYVRKGRGSIKVQAPVDNLYNCNYMMYQNNGFTNKWFYAFITSVEYVSTTVAQITFIIDQLQTWFFDMNLKQCYIEREHTNNDAIGANLIPEGLETGEYIYEDNDYDWCYEFVSYDVVAFTTFASNWNGSQWLFSDTRGRYMWGIYTGLNIRVFRSIEQQGTVEFINSFVTAAEQYEQGGIVAMIMIPHVALDDQLNPNQIAHHVPKIYSLDGYVPRNNKLLTSPYAFIEAHNCEGAVAVLPQEYFGGQDPYNCYFMITFNVTCAPVSLCVPINYKGSEYALTEALYINNFSQCSYNTDLYKAYMAQSLTAKIGQAITDPIMNSSFGKTVSDVSKDVSKIWSDAIRPVLGLEPIKDTDYINSPAQSIKDALRSEEALNQSLGAFLVGGLFGDSVAASIYNDMATMYTKSIQAPHNTGGNTPDYLTSNRLKGFWFFHRTIRNEFARKLDKFFDRYGYATHDVKIPNTHVRLNWTYTKTIGCEITGDIPVEAESEIKAMFDKGITFWTNPALVGDYTQPNPVING